MLFLSVKGENVFVSYRQVLRSQDHGKTRRYRATVHNSINCVHASKTFIRNLDKTYNNKTTPGPKDILWIIHAVKTPDM